MVDVDKLLENSTISMTNLWTHLHIVDIRRNEVIFSNFCPKDKCDERRFYNDIEITMKRENFGLEEWDFLVGLFDRCRKSGSCPQVHIHLEIEIYPKDLYETCANKGKSKKVRK